MISKLTWMMIIGSTCCCYRLSVSQPMRSEDGMAIDQWEASIGCDPLISEPTVGCWWGGWSSGLHHLTSHLGRSNTGRSGRHNLYSVSKMVLKTKSRPSLTSLLHSVHCPKLGLTKYHCLVCHMSVFEVKRKWTHVSEAELCDPKRYPSWFIKTEMSIDQSQPEKSH